MQYLNETASIAIELKFTYKSIVKKLECFCLIGFTLELIVHFFMWQCKIKFHRNTINQINIFILIAFYSFYITDLTSHFLIVILLLKGHILFKTNKILSNHLRISYFKIKSNILTFVVYLVACFILIISLSYNSGLIIINEQQTQQLTRYFLNQW